MLQTHGPFFKDESQRTVMLRGINLGANSKLPLRPNGASHLNENFLDHRSVSFVGRPFPLEEADEHLARLKSWGFTFLRFLVTWEAIEHGGPGIYDEEYLDYVVQVVKKAAQHGISLFIDPHQDCWSRFSGGDGAPGWTFDVLGMDISQFAETGAAILHHVGNNHDPLHLVWPTNYFKMASATLFTLFFAGNDFAPQTRVNGETAQDFLQRHFFNAFKQLASRLKDFPNVVGFDSLNEPSAGYIGWGNLAQPHRLLRIGPTPSPFQGMASASGISQNVGNWDMSLLLPIRHGSSVLNPNHQSLWQEGTSCIWRNHGVWDIDAQGNPLLLKPDYFTHVQGHKVVFHKDYAAPFFQKFTSEIRSVFPRAIMFYGLSPQQKLPAWVGDCNRNVANSTHWYDAVTLLTKSYRSWLSFDYRTIRLVLGASSVRQMFAHQLSEIKKWTDSCPDSAPTLVGEFGIPFDLAKKYAYRRGDFSQQEQALDACYIAMENNLLNCALWNYTPVNNNQWGDQWYEEDFSIFSSDQCKNPGDINSGGRALRAVVRPYPAKIAGKPLHLSFNIYKRLFQFKFRHDPAVSAPTEIFVPNFQYPSGYQVEVSDGHYEVDAPNQVLFYYHTPEQEVHQIKISPG